MGRNIIQYTTLFVILILVQVLICNHIMLFGVAVPILFFYFILRLPMGMPVKGVLTLAFLIGVIMDISSDTPGVNALSCTILAVCRRPVYHAFTGNDETLAIAIPSISTLGPTVYIKYLFTCVLLYCTICVSIEYFTFVDIQRTLSIIGGSTLLSFILMLGVDSLMGGRKDR